MRQGPPQNLLEEAVHISRRSPYKVRVGSRTLQRQSTERDAFLRDASLGIGAQNGLRNLRAGLPIPDSQLVRSDHQATRLQEPFPEHQGLSGTGRACDQHHVVSKRKTFSQS